MEQEEQVVAVLPEVVEGKTVAEAEMSREVTAVEERAGQITIATQGDYEDAAAFGRLIKQKSAQIIEFFAPMKKAAHEAHQNICTREKEMLAPLIAAEKTVKQVTSVWFTGHFTDSWERTPTLLSKKVLRYCRVRCYGWRYEDIYQSLPKPRIAIGQLHGCGHNKGRAQISVKVQVKRKHHRVRAARLFVQ